MEGTVREGPKKGTLEIRLGEGTTLVVPSEDVARIERKQSPAEEFDARLARTAAGDLEALEDLVVWARDRQLSNRARAAARKILEIDSNNELARKELGYVVFENRWIPESELKKRKGLVRHHGEWMTEGEKARRESEEAKREMKDLLGLLLSDNQHIQEYAFQKLLAIKDPVARDVFAEHLKDEREGIRWVAVRGLAGFSASGSGDAASKAIALTLHELVLKEKNDKSLSIYYFTIARFFPSESRRLAEATAAQSPEEQDRRRAKEILDRLSRPLK